MTALRTNLVFVALVLSLLGVVMVYSATYRLEGTEFLVARLVRDLVGDRGAIPR